MSICDLSCDPICDPSHSDTYHLEQSIIYTYDSIHASNYDYVSDVFVNNKDIKIFNSKRYKTNNTHGTGCTLSSAVTTFLSCGKPAKKSCELGIKYVSSAIKTNPNYGKGYGPINHLTSIKVNRKFN